MGPVRTVAVKLIAEISSFKAKLGEAGGSVQTFGAGLDKLAKDSPAKFNGIVRGTAAAGVGLLATAGAAVKLSSDFDKAMSGVAAATHAPQQELGKLREAALKAGADTQFSATEAAQGMTELAKAGVSTGAILRGGLAGALDLAAAGQISVAEAAETAATAMTQFRLSGRDIPHLADLLAAGAGKAQGSVSDMGMALKQSGLVASQFGLSIEDTTGTLGAFASAGLIGSDAGTSFKSMLLALANPAKESRDLMDQLGIKAYDAAGSFVGITNLAGQLRAKLGGLTQAQRDQALAQIFGNDAIRAANVLYQQGQSGIETWIGKVNDAGYAAETAATLTDNLAGDVERLTGSLDTLAIQSGSGANVGLRKLAQSAEQLVDNIAELPGWVQQTGVVLAALTGTALLAGAGMLKARQQVLEAVDALTAMGPAGAKAGRGLQVAAKSATIATAAFVGLQVVDVIADQFKEAYPPTVKLGQALLEFAKTGKTGSDAAKIFGGDLGLLKEDIDNIASAGGLQKAAAGLQAFGGAAADITGPLAVTAGGFNEATERVKEADAALADLVNRGNADEARRAVEALGLSSQQAGTLLPAYSAALTEMDLAAKESAAAQAQTSQAALNVQTSFTEAHRAADGLRQAFEQLNGKALDADDALSVLEQAYDDATESIKDNGRTLDIHSDAGRKNRDALKDIARAASEALQAMTDNGAGVDVVNAKYAEARQRFIAVATAMTGSRREAEKLADQWFRMPSKVTTPVTAPGLETTLSRAARVNAQLDRMDGRRVTSYATLITQELHREDARQYNRRWGGVTEHAQTGLLRDAGVYSAASPARYAFAEPATGGEAFVPRRGSYDRSMSILSQAARWYGASVVPGGQQAAPSTAAISPEALGRAVRGALQGMTVVMDGRAVGELTGRDADRFRRGG